MKVAERMWSVMTRRDTSILSLCSYLAPVISDTLLVMFMTVSTSKREATFWLTQARRSRPMPVSMFFCLSSV